MGKFCYPKFVVNVVVVVLFVTLDYSCIIETKGVQTTLVPIHDKNNNKN